jgi:hypothetical protein
MRRTARLALILGGFANGAAWTHSQANAQRDNSAASALPDPVRGVKTSSVLPALTSGRPVLHSAGGVLVSATSCNITFISPALDRTKTWAACSYGVGNVTGMALHDDAPADPGNVLLVLTQRPGSATQAWRRSRGRASCGGR